MVNLFCKQIYHKSTLLFHEFIIKVQYYLCLTGLYEGTSEEVNGSFQWNS